MEWQAIERIHPFDAERIEYQIAQLGLQMYGAWRGEKSPDLMLKDMLVFDEHPEQKEEQKQTAEDQVAIGEAMVASGFVKKG